MMSIINRKYSDPEFLPISESITKADERTLFDTFEYAASVARW